jgi:two-component system NtrC family sensor kinase
MRKTQIGRAAALPFWPGLPPGEDPFRQFVDSVLDYAICLLDRDGCIRSWNAGAERINGHAAAEIVGQSLDVLYPPAVLDRGQPQDLLETAAESGRARVEGWRLRRNGSRFWAETTITALHDHDSEV